MKQANKTAQPTLFRGSNSLNESASSSNSGKTGRNRTTFFHCKKADQSHAWSACAIKILAKGPVDLTPVGFTGVFLILIRDPDGNIIEFVGPKL